MTTPSFQGADMPGQILADVETRIAHTTFHLFPELPAELRIEIWDVASKTIPLQIHLYLVEEDDDEYHHEYVDDNPDGVPAVGFEIRYPAMLWRNMKYQKQRMKAILPLLHTNRESRRTVFERYSIVPLGDFFVTLSSPTHLVPKNLCPVVRRIKLAIDWREDAVFWSDDCPLPSLDLPWAKHLCNATKLCMPMDDDLTFDVDWDELGTRQTVDEAIKTWTRSFLPVFSKLEEITFVITDVIDRGERMGFGEEDVGSLPEEPRWAESPFTPFPNFSVLGSDIDGGCLMLNKYPLGPLTGRAAEGEKPYWWQPLLSDSLDSVRLFQYEIGRARPGMKLHLGLDSKMIEEWSQQHFESDALDELKNRSMGVMTP